MPSHSPIASRIKHGLARFMSPGTIGVLDKLMWKIRRARIRTTMRGFGLLSFNVVKRADYYSTLPVLSEIERTRDRWDRPSGLAGVAVDLGAQRATLEKLSARWSDEFADVAGDYLENTRRGFGPGYPEIDARTLYYMLREHRPARYLEVGSGLSTYYASLAAARNAADGAPTHITCIEPYPFDALHTVSDIDLVQSFVQDVPLERFDELDDGDVLFIDSSHALKIDSDVAYLFMEVLPRLKPGVRVHIHDVHFPYNTPYPADTWLFGERWPVFWNEAMIVQAFLAFNSAFRIELSVPLLRHEREADLESMLEGYVPVASDPNPPSSLWLRRVATAEELAP